MALKQLHNKVVNKKAVECEPVPGCIALALEVLGDKWTPLLLKELAENGALKFSEISAALPRLSPRTLSQRLHALADEDIVLKTPYSIHPLRFEYRLSTKGIDLTVILRAMADWGEKYSPSHRSS